MSEDLREEMKKMKEEIASLKQQLADTAEGSNLRKRHGIHIDFGNNMHDYVGGMMHDIAEGVQGELERSICIGPGGIRIFKHGEPMGEPEEEEVDLEKVAQAMNALAHEHRLKILRELISGGKYINDFQQVLSDITASTLSSHLGVLEEAGLVVQEKVRGRYLVTLPGRTAYRMAKRAAKFLAKDSET